MKILKNYELFVESRKTNELFKNYKKTNEGFFSNMRTKWDSFINIFVDKMSVVWDYIVDKYGKSSWWYAATALNSENMPEDEDDDNKNKPAFSFYPNSISDTERNKIIKEVDEMYEEGESEVQSQKVQVQAPIVTNAQQEDANKRAQEQSLEDDEPVAQAQLRAQGEETGKNIRTELTQKEKELAYESLNNKFKKYNVKSKLNEAARKLKDDEAVPVKSIDGTRDVTMDELKTLIKDAFAVKCGDSADMMGEPEEWTDEVQKEYQKKGGVEQQSIFIWGAPGVGKTEALKQVTKDLGIDLIVWHLATKTAADFIGNPGIEVDDEGKKRSVFFLPKIFPTDNGPSGKGAIFFFDEMNTAPTSVYNAALSLCLEGKVDNYVMPSKILIVAAGNRPEDVPGKVVEMSKALLNRFGHVNLTTTIEEWKEWAMTLGAGKVLPEIIGFIEYMPEFFHKLVPKDKQKGWCSPRQWTKASRMLMQIKERLTGDRNGRIPKKETYNLLSTYVGDEAANAYVNYLDLVNYFTMDDLRNVYENPKKAPKFPSKSGEFPISRAIALNLAYFKRGQKLTDKEIENYVEWAMTEERRELAALFMVYVKRQHDGDVEKITHNETYKKMMRKFNTYYNEGGVKKTDASMTELNEK